MGSLFRSETMQYFKIVFPDVNAHQVISRLGRLGSIHFVDRNHDPQSAINPFNKLVKKCAELEDVLATIGQTMESFDIKIRKCPDLDFFFLKLE